jgi:hypothetical protein
MSFDTNERPPVVALPAQVVTLEALLQQSTGDAAGGDKAGAAAAADGGGGGGGKGALGLTYVMASGGKLWSTALRMESKRAEGGAERTVRCDLLAGWLAGWLACCRSGGGVVVCCVCVCVIEAWPAYSTV